MRRHPGDRRWAFTVIAAALSILALAACGDDTDGGTEADAAGTDGEASVDLQEWAVVPDQQSAPAGEVTFSVENVGEEVHEFVIIKTDLDPGSLPTADDGSVSETGEGMEVVDEIEDLQPGDSSELTVDLDAGTYALICNVLEEEEDGEFESHYQMGMRTAFTVE